MPTQDYSLYSPVARRINITSLIGTGKRKVGFIGDSITAGADSYTPNGLAVGGADNNNSPSTYAMLNAGRGAWELIQNAGIGGQTSTQIAARIQKDIIDIGCDICVIYSCTMNDIGQGLSLDTSSANVQFMLNACIQQGVLPILCTPTAPAVAETLANKILISQRRALFLALGDRFNIPVVDLFPVFTDPTTGGMLAAYNAGDVHPNALGRRDGGIAVANILDRICVGDGRSGIAWAGNTDDLLSGNGFMLNAAVAGVAGGWTGGSAVTGATPSIFSDPVLGNMQRITTSATTGNYYITRFLSTLDPTHTYELSGYISKNGTSDAQISINPASGNRRITYVGTNPDITRGKFSVRWTPGGSNTSATYYLVTGPGTGTVDFGRLTIRDLTALGLG